MANKLTNKEITSSLMQLGAHIRNLDYLLMHFVQFLGKGDEFKKYVQKKQDELKEKMDAEQKSKGEKDSAKKEK